MFTQKQEYFIPDNLPLLDDDELLELLFTSADSLPRRAVDEFIKRGERMVWPLWQIIRDKNYWETNNNEWWAVIHATFILGAIGGRDVVIPLIMSMRFADAYECDWIWEVLPSIFGSLGEKAAASLKTVVLDMSNNWFVKGVALDGLAAITLKQNKLEREIFDFIASVLKNQGEEMDLRGWAGSILLNFRQKNYEKSLLAFVEEEKTVKGQYTWRLDFDEEEVAKALAAKEPRLNDYTNDWLDFYSEKAIAARQKRWQEEHSLAGKLKSWWRLKIIKFRLSRMDKEKIVEKLYKGND